MEPSRRRQKLLPITSKTLRVALPAGNSAAEGKRNSPLQGAANLQRGGSRLVTIDVPANGDLARHSSLRVVLET